MKYELHSFFAMPCLTYANRVGVYRIMTLDFRSITEFKGFSSETAVTTAVTKNESSTTNVFHCVDLLLMVCFYVSITSDYIFL